MKRVVASAGVLAVGMAGLQGANVTGLTPQEQSKWWIVSGSLRGFYDDNSLNQPDELAEESLGVEIHPGISVNIPGERTLFSASYDLTLNYYNERPSEKIDQTHIFDTRLNHRFSERYDVNAENLFIYSDEPAVVEGGTVDTVVRRGDASGLRNRALIDFSGKLTPVVGFTAGYKNNFRDYTQTGIGSYSALLDSVDNRFHLDAQLFRSETTIYFTGYEFGAINYTSSDAIGVGIVPGLSREEEVLVYPRTRNTYSHYFYMGTRQAFTRKLSGAVSVGAQYTDYYNANDSTWSPYLDLKANYTYQQSSSAQIGLSVARSPADIGIVSQGEELTLDALVGNFYSSISHRFSSRLTGVVLLNFQHSIYNGGTYDGESNDYLTLDSRVDYKLREYLFLDLGYVWTLYSSTIPNSDFTRNRVYFGIRATY